MLVRGALLVVTLACCCSAQLLFNQFRQQLGRRQQQSQRRQQGLGIRIGLVGSQLGGLDPVPGSDYPSRIVNNRPQTQQSLQQQPTATVYTGDPVQGRDPEGTVSSSCYCSQRGQCPHNGGFDGAGLLDVRIVNKRPTVVNSQLQCGGQGEEVCCPPGSGGQSSGSLVQQPYSGCPAVGQRKCGERSIIPVPGYTVQPAEAQFGAYPWVATILRPGDAYVSSGVLVDQYWVLTVAHHIKKYQNNYSGLKIRFGEWDANDPNREPCSHQERSVAAIFVHPQYDSSNLHNDVALLRLAEPVALQGAPHINTGCLPPGGASFDGRRCWVAGFGKDAFGQGGRYSYIQREVDVPVVGYDTCQYQLRQTRLGGDFNLDGRSFICAGGEPGKDSCEGDGGAPLTCDNGRGQWEVVGLVAWGVGCAEANRPGVYVNVASYVDWIRSVAGRYQG